MHRTFWLPVLLLVALTVKGVEPMKNGEYVLSDFGELTNPSTCQAALDKAAAAIIANGGGVLVIPPGAPEAWTVVNNFQTDRNSGPTVTIIDRRKGYATRHLPAVGQATPTGWFGQMDYRLLNLPGQGLPFQGTHEMTGIRNAVVRGASSYMQLISEAVTKGKDRRIYVPSIRSIFVGQFLTLTSKRYGYAPPYDRLWVKAIGWDAERKLNYLVADLEYDHEAGCILYNKHVTGSVKIDSTANCDNQTMELQVSRHQYAHGDSFLISGHYVYQGDVFSGLGDERGVVLNAEVIYDPDPFYGVVESVNWADDALVFKPGVGNVHKLATSRALINLNTNAWLTSGHVVIVSPEDWFGHNIQNANEPALIENGIEVAKFSLADITTWDGHPVRAFQNTYQGRAYPSLVHAGINYLGGYIEGSADCGWSEEVVGRFFAVADPGEYLTPDDGTSGVVFGSVLRGPQYRWYLIKQFKRKADGTCRIKIERIRWAAVDAGAPKLFNADNYTRDGHVRPLPYFIAPGAYAHDVGEGWKDTKSGETVASDPRTIRLVPNGDRGTRFDFKPGDPIVQAVGADPAIPVPIRVRMFNQMPGTMEDAAVELNNLGRVQVNSGILFGGLGHNRDDLARRKDRKPFFETGLNFTCVVGTGMRFKADVSEAAIAFEQPNGHAQPIVWQHAAGQTTLTVDPADGGMKITGSQLAVSAVNELRGISATPVAARNLRGINVPVPAAAHELNVTFERPEADGKYSLHVQPNWLTHDAVSQKTATGYTVIFSTPAPKGASLDWQLVR